MGLPRSWCHGPGSALPAELPDALAGARAGLEPATLRVWREPAPFRPAAVLRCGRAGGDPTHAGGLVGRSRTCDLRVRSPAGCPRPYDQTGTSSFCPAMSAPLAHPSTLDRRRDALAGVVLRGGALEPGAHGCVTSGNSCRGHHSAAVALSENAARAVRAVLSQAGPRGIGRRDVVR